MAARLIALANALDGMGREAAARSGGMDRQTLRDWVRERFLSLRLFADLGAIIDGCCEAWNRLTAEPGRIASLTDYPFLRSVRIS